MNTWKKLIHLCLFFLPLTVCMGQKVTILDHKNRIRINPLAALNSGYRETNISITPNGKYLYFMSVRGQQPWSSKYMTYKGQEVYDGDIWFSKKNNAGSWQRPTCLPYGINTNQGEDEPNISPDGKTVAFQSWKSFWEMDDGPYYTARLKDDGSWTAPVGMGGGITQFFLETGFNATDGMTLSPDGRTFIVACGTDYDGKMDLYVSRKKSNGWSYLQRLPVSSKGDERSCFIAADGKSIYFASDGYEGFGGLDIFKATLHDDGSVGEVINIGEPFNTSNDDYGFILTRDGNEAYFIREGDIYFADLKEADDRIKPIISVTLNGIVKDAATHKGIPQADILLVDVKTGKTIQKLKTKNTGKYAITLPNEKKDVKLIAIMEGYPSETQEVEVEKTGFDHSYTVNFELTRDAPDFTHVKMPAPTYSDPVVVEQKYMPRCLDYPVVPLANTTASPLEYGLRELEVNRQKLNPIEDPHSFEGYAANHLILLLDASGSMASGDRMPLLKKTLMELANYMRPEDRITILTYSGNVGVAAENIPANKIDVIESALKRIGTGGGTHAKEGLKKALDIAEEYHIEGGNNRIILATDGAFDVDDLYALANKAEKKGIFVSVFGFGKPGLKKEEELRNLALRGNGNYTTITPTNAEEMLIREAKAIRK